MGTLLMGNFGRRAIFPELTLEQKTLIENNTIARTVLSYLFGSGFEDFSYSWQYIRSTVNKDPACQNCLVGERDEDPLEETLFSLLRENFVNYSPRPKTKSRHWRSIREPRLALKKGFYPSTKEGIALRRAIEYYSR